MKLCLLLLAAVGANGLSCTFDGKQHNVGEYWDNVEDRLADICVLYRCNATSATSAKVEIVDTGCRDSDGFCRGVNDGSFPAVINGTQYENCGCERYGEHGVRTYCSGQGSGAYCISGGQRYEVGETLDTVHNTMCVGFTCQRNQADPSFASFVLTNRECLSADGTCYPLYERGFSAVIRNNTLYDCVCLPYKESGVRRQCYSMYPLK